MDDVSVVAQRGRTRKRQLDGEITLTSRENSAELAQKVRGAFFLAPLVRAWRAGDARVRRAMPPLSGKDAILAAARRLAELGDDAALINRLTAFANSDRSSSIQRQLSAEGRALFALGLAESQTRRPSAGPVRSFRKAAARATGMHGFFSRSSRKPVPSRRQLR